MKPVHIHALNPCEKTHSQFENCHKEDFVVAAALMPDAHAGYVAPIGSVLVTKDYIVPSWVGFDIGCGMTATQLKNITSSQIRDNKEKIFAALKEFVPHGMGVSNKTDNVSETSKIKLKELITTFKSKPHQKQVLNLLQSGGINHLGSLGDGNHFLEICDSDKDDNAWIVVHSGSRGIGYKLAKKYMLLAAKEETEFEQTFPLHKDSLEGQEYLNVLEFGLAFALLNRMEMTQQTIKAIESVLNTQIEQDIWTNKNHNHAIEENGTFVHRKGATPAKLGERGVIPGNMRDGSFLVEGLGNADFLHSSSHGAGRLMGRVVAKQTLDYAEYVEQMKDVLGTVNENTLDEAPNAYKNIYDVMDKQKASVKTIAQLKPIICLKGERMRRHK